MTAALRGPVTPLPRHRQLFDVVTVRPRSEARRALIRTADDQLITPTARVQIAEIGGRLLHTADWEAVAPGNGVDRGIDVQVRIDGTTAGEARIHFRRDGARLHGDMIDAVRAESEAGRALLWRAVVICARSLRLASLTVPAASASLGRLSARELRELGEEAERLETARQSAAKPHIAPPRQAATTPTGVRLEPHGGVSGIRRVADIIIAATALVGFAPVALVVAFLVRRSSPGPILFRQLRLGRGGRPFELLKFRTMDNSRAADVHRSSVEASLRNGTADAKIDDDPRITKIGHFLRAWSLDEVPQFINVLRGEMTLVGPRPSLLWETSMFTPRTRRRLQMTPGIAGLWQASGRGDLSMEEMLELDLEYVDQASVWKDTALIAKTARAVVTRKGAR